MSEPIAVARYRELRAQGASPVEAMKQVAQEHPEGAPPREHVVRIRRKETPDVHPVVHPRPRADLDG